MRTEIFLPIFSSPSFPSQDFYVYRVYEVDGFLGIVILSVSSRSKIRGDTLLVHLRIVFSFFFFRNKNNARVLMQI